MKTLGLKVWHVLVRNAQREILERTLETYQGNVTHAAQALEIGRPYLARLIKDLAVRRGT